MALPRTSPHPASAAMADASRSGANYGRRMPVMRDPVTDGPASDRAAGDSGLFHASFTLGRIAGVQVGVNWSWLLVFALVPWSLATHRMAAAPAPRRRTPATPLVVRERRAPLQMSDVLAGRPGLAPVRHDRARAARRKFATRGTHGGTQMSAAGAFVGVRWGLGPRGRIHANLAPQRGLRRVARCRRRDSNPRHADYDSARGDDGRRKYLQMDAFVRRGNTAEYAVSGYIRGRSG